MNELSLFSGIGGGLLASKLLGWKTLGYVEFNDYCQKIIKARIEDDILDKAPIFGNVQAFISEGYAKSYKGMVDVITAGFPCQPFSVAGKQRGPSDPRNMWPETIECIRIIRPRFAFLENVPGLLAHPYGRTIFRDLAKSGYKCRWRILSAAEMGADHIRSRLWIVAHSKYERLQPNRESNYIHNQGRAQSALVEQNLLERATEKDAITGATDFPKPLLFRNVDDVPDWVERLKALGNGQVPRVFAKAWMLLNDFSA